ncbi:MAG: MCE family protein [Candidatus Gastranaerophilales bacterium]|nr:MCE family protein [Candidatus Gastranaerophilales bacterium]
MRKRYIREIIVWTILLGIVFTCFIFGYSKLFVEPNVYNIQFKDIDGITKGSPVRFMGINVGYVRRLKSDKKHIDVQILITKKNMKIPNGTVARVEFYGMGGSKSIELMPPDGSSNVGILTGDNIRINDVVLEAIGLVDVVEEIEKFVKNIDKDATKNALDTVAKFKNENILKLNKDLDKKMDNIDSNSSILNKEKNLNEKVKNLNNSLEKDK